jgi:ribosomal protein S12 methylthiotransferase accessory factor YcaO
MGRSFSATYKEEELYEYHHQGFHLSVRRRAGVAPAEDDRRFRVEDEQEQHILLFIQPKFHFQYRYPVAEKKQSLENQGVVCGIAAHRSTASATIHVCCVSNLFIRTKASRPLL